MYQNENNKAEAMKYFNLFEEKLEQQKKLIPMAALSSLWQGNWPNTGT